MKRAHRRIHLLLWPIVFLVGALGLLAALRSAPAEPAGDIPSAAMTDGGR